MRVKHLLPAVQAILRNEGWIIEEDSYESEKYFYTVVDVKAILGVSKATAYREIKKLNDELKSKGYITISGKVPVKYFMERLYC